METEILWNWRRRAQTVLKRAGAPSYKRLEDHIALALQKAYAEGRNAALPKS